jgi:hypothetical protein
MALLQSTGKLTMLRVHDVGTGYGAQPNFLDTEVVLKLHSEANKAFGFKLRPDQNGAVREGMLDLLRDAMTNDWPVTIDYDMQPGLTVGEVIRVALTR